MMNIKRTALLSLILLWIPEAATGAELHLRQIHDNLKSKNCGLVEVIVDGRRVLIESSKIKERNVERAQFVTDTNHTKDAKNARCVVATLIRVKPEIYEAWKKKAPGCDYWIVEGLRVHRTLEVRADSGGYTRIRREPTADFQKKSAGSSVDWTVKCSPSDEPVISFRIQKGLEALEAQNRRLADTNSALNANVAALEARIVKLETLIRGSSH